MILAHPGTTRALEDLAAQAGTSARALSRLFSTQTHLSFKEWRQRARIVAAVQALGAPGTSRISIKQVATQLGFSSSTAFAHAFRQTMGMTPGEMLRQGHRPQT